MSVRAAADPAAIAAADQARPSWRVARAAADLDCDPSQVRKLIRAGKLDAHRVGIRGVRVFADSVRAYKESRRIGRPPAAPAPQAPPLGRPGAEHREAMAYLRSLGVRI